jgi:hypothetical protein
MNVKVLEIGYSLTTKLIEYYVFKSSVNAL